MSSLSTRESTYPDGDEAQVERHRELLTMEKAGTVTRHLDMEHSDQVAVRHVIWDPVAGAAAPAPEDEPAP